MVLLFFIKTRVRCILFKSIYRCCLLVLLHVGVVEASDEPSAGAQGMTGTTGTIELKPDDWKPGELTWWKDSDGIDPLRPGCHIGTHSDGTPNGRMFGEACLADGRLVESNPGAVKLHSHSNDIGHPDTFDCNAWCIGQGSATGICKVAAAPPCEQSAMCACESLDANHGDRGAN
jgi:hypothetical protein